MLHHSDTAIDDPRRFAGVFVVSNQTTPMEVPRGQHALYFVCHLLVYSPTCKLPKVSMHSQSCCLTGGCHDVECRSRFATVDSRSGSVAASRTGEPPTILFASVMQVWCATDPRFSTNAFHRVAFLSVGQVVRS